MIIIKYFNWFFIFLVVGILFSNYVFADSNKSTLNLYTDKISQGLKVSIKSSIICSSIETFIDELVTPFNEESVFSGARVIRNGETVIYEIFYNHETQSFTIAQHFAIGNTCFLGGGKVFKGSFKKKFDENKTIPINIFTNYN